MFNGISMMKMISNMPWDANNTNSADILHVTTHDRFDCNQTTHYRVGGFVGSRTCEDNLSASIIPNTPRAVTYLENDIGDYSNTDANASYYGLHVNVRYIDDNISYTNQTATIAINSNSTTPTTNLKYVDINVSYQGRRGNHRELTQFNYTSANIGQMILHKRVWR
jgi:hypothetical protein